MAICAPRPIDDGRDATAGFAAAFGAGAGRAGSRGFAAAAGAGSTGRGSTAFAADAGDGNGRGGSSLISTGFGMSGSGGRGGRSAGLGGGATSGGGTTSGGSSNESFGGGAGLFINWAQRLSSMPLFAAAVGDDDSATGFVDAGTGDGAAAWVAPSTPLNACWQREQRSPRSAGAPQLPQVAADCA
jgi:hypothetical protein